ncbi:MAG: hypothetical protein ACREET_02620 [Stellaceae bacterium]
MTRYLPAMDGTIYLDRAVGAQPSPAFMGFFAALAHGRASGEVRLAEAELALAEGEAAIQRGIEAIARMVANDRAAAEGGGRLDWDYRIERLEFYEAEAARDAAKIRRLVDRILSFETAASQLPQDEGFHFWYQELTSPKGRVSKHARRRCSALFPIPALRREANASGELYAAVDIGTHQIYRR